jgi:hypothetical protein
VDAAGNGVGCAEKTGRHMVLIQGVSILVINILQHKTKPRMKQETNKTNEMSETSEASKTNETN